MNRNLIAPLFFVDKRTGFVRPQDSTLYQRVSLRKKTKTSSLEENDVQHDNNNIELAAIDTACAVRDDGGDVGADDYFSIASSRHLSDSEESDTRSTNQFCFNCGHDGNWKALIECDNCHVEWVCSTCLERSGIAVDLEERYICTTCENQQERLSFAPVADAQVESGMPQLPYLFSNEELPSLQSLLVNSALKLRNVGPIISSSISKWASEGKALSKSFYNSHNDRIDDLFREKKVTPLSAEQRQALLDSSPPDNIHRILRDCGETGIRTEDLAVPIDISDKDEKVEAYTRFSFRSVYD